MKPTTKHDSDIEILQYAKHLVETAWLHTGGLIGVREGTRSDDYWYCLVASIYCALDIRLHPDAMVRTFDASDWVRSENYTFTVAIGNSQNEWIIKRAFQTIALRRRILNLFRLFTEVTGAKDLERWNDDPHRELDEVLDAFDQVIALVRQRG